MDSSLSTLGELRGVPGTACRAPGVPVSVIIGTRTTAGGRAGRTAGWAPTLASLALLALGALATYGYTAAEDAHVDAEWAVCHDLPVSAQMYVTAYAAVVCGLAAVLTAYGLMRRPAVSPPGSAVVRGLVLGAGLVLLVFQFMIVWWLYQPSPGGPISCAG